jgi:hypothetical protein
MVCAETGALIIFVFPLADHRDATKEYLKLKANKPHQPAEVDGTNSLPLPASVIRHHRGRQNKGPEAVKGAQQHLPTELTLPVCVEEGQREEENVENVRTVEGFSGVKLDHGKNEVDRELEGQSCIPGSKEIIDSPYCVEEVIASSMQKGSGIGDETHGVCNEDEFVHAMSLVRPLTHSNLLPVESEYCSQKI